jgi:hypothetical protein
VRTTTSKHDDEESTLESPSKARESQNQRAAQRWRTKSKTAKKAKKGRAKENV